MMLAQLSFALSPTTTTPPCRHVRVARSNDKEATFWVSCEQWKLELTAPQSPETKKQSHFWIESLVGRRSCVITLSKIKIPRNFPQKADHFRSLRDLVVIRVKSSAQHGSPYIAQIGFSVQRFWSQDWTLRFHRYIVAKVFGFAIRLKGRFKEYPSRNLNEKRSTQTHSENSTWVMGVSLWSTMPTSISPCFWACWKTRVATGIGFFPEPSWKITRSVSLLIWHIKMFLSNFAWDVVASEKPPSPKPKSSAGPTSKVVSEEL